MFSTSYNRALPLLMLVAVLCLSIAPSQAGLYCNAHQYYTGGKCDECDATCDECTYYTPGYCSNCTDGYQRTSTSSSSSSNMACSFTCTYTSQFLNFNNQSCGSCSRYCIRGCMEAQDNCNPCFSGSYYRPDINNCNSSCPAYGGYYASSSENRCIPCRDKNCLSCGSNGDCSECKSFWHRNSTTGRCSWKCPKGCKSCTEGGVCTQCEYGWTNSSGYCQCPYSNCRECGTTSCTRCEEGYLLDSNNYCRMYVSNCRQYNSTTTSEICEPGYYLYYNTCYQCSTGCRHCTSGNGCTACENGYYMNTTYYSYPTCFVKTIQPPKPNSSNAGLIIGLSIGGVLLCLIFVGIIIAQVNKKKKEAAAVVGAADTSAMNYTQYNDISTYSNPVVSYPPNNHPQQHFYQDNQNNQQQGNKVYYPGFN